MALSSQEISDWNRVTSPFGTHRPLLLRALQMASGPVLELGSGHESTPYLHRFCADANQPLVTCDSDATWLSRFENLRTSAHDLIQVQPGYPDVPVERYERWAVVLIDNAPAEQRHVDAIRLSQRAAVVVIHDVENEAGYHLHKVWPCYTHKIFDRSLFPHTVALSNFLAL